MACIPCTAHLLNRQQGYYTVCMHECILCMDHTYRQSENAGFYKETGIKKPPTAPHTAVYYVW